MARHSMDSYKSCEMAFVPSNYTDVHRSFLQILMNQRMISKADALRLFCKIYDLYGAQENLSEDQYIKKMGDAVSLINKVINKFSQEIRSAEDEITCEMFYVFIFTMEKPIMRKMNKYTADELEYFKNILQEVVTSDDGYVSTTLCLNLNTSLSKNYTVSDLENLLNKFCRDLWLVQKDGKISLSLLSIVELEPVITTHYDECVGKCHLCKRIVIQGYRCENCLTLLHLSCVRRYTKGQKTPTCPQCCLDQPSMIAAISNLQIHNYDDNVNDNEPGPSHGNRKRRHR